MSYIFTTHHTPLMVAEALGEELKPSGAYLAPMVPKQKYRLMNAQGSPMAVINLIVSKSGSETATLFAMNQVDVGLASSTAFISGVDKGTPVKILFPLHVDGMSMVFPPDVTIKGYEEVAKAIRASDTPFKIGYHSPTSALRVVFEGALHKAGFNITGNAIVLVTHSVDEAVFLADEIVIMTSRPGRIRNKIKVDMERPRTRALPRFGEMTDFILRELA